MGRGEHGAVAPEPLPAPIPQQGEFKEEMPDIEEGGKLRRQKKGKMFSSKKRKGENK
jgi:hypothetical protein